MRLVYVCTDFFIRLSLCIFFLRSTCLVRVTVNFHAMGWLWLVGSLKIHVSFAKYSLFYRALLQTRPMFLPPPSTCLLRCTVSLHTIFSAAPLPSTTLFWNTPSRASPWWRKHSLVTNRTKSFLEYWGCRTRQPGRTWLIGPEAVLVLIQNAGFVRDNDTK